MRILMIKMDPPFPLESGTDWVSYHLLKTLLAEHEVTYVTLTRAPADERAVHEIARLGARVVAMRQPNTKSAVHRVFYKALYLLMTMLTGVPMIVWYNTPGCLRRRVKRLMAEEDFDLIHVEYWYAAPYVRYARSGRRVLLKHDVAYLADRRLLEHRRRGLARYWGEKSVERRKRAEIRFCREFDAVFTLTGPDRDVFDGILGGRPPVLALPSLVLPFPTGPARRDPASRRIVFVGHLGRPIVVDAVTWFCDEILPRIRKESPQAVFEIIGGQEKRVRHLAARPGVEVTGYVEDVRSRLEGAAVMVVPLRAGSGIKVKIVEAMMAGLAIVTTSVGLEGIDARHGSELMLADDAVDFARCTLDLLADPALRGRIGDAAQAFARERYASDAARRSVLDFYRSEIPKDGGNPSDASARARGQSVSQAVV